MSEPIQEASMANGLPKQHSLFRLITDQARVDDDVLRYEYEGTGTVEDPYVVTWIPEDAGNPMNWKTSFRWIIATTVALECFATAFSSSAFSGTLRELIHEFHASTTLLAGGISLFVLGFALGPLLWGPLSEVYGRQKIFCVTFGLFTVFSAGTTARNSIATLLALRFFAGSFGSSPLTNAGGVIADIFPVNERTPAMAIFSLAPSMGPTLGPLLGGLSGQSVGWRWVMGLMTMLAGMLWIFGTLLVPETYAPVLLRERARKLSKITGMVYETRFDIETGHISPVKTLTTALFRPWLLLFFEPIVLVLSIYVSIIYGTLYLLFGAFPIVFQVGRGWSEGVSGLAFLGVAIGMISAIATTAVLNRVYLGGALKNGDSPPEAGLIGCLIGSVAVPIGLFWFAWTSSPSVNYMSPIAAGVPFGFGFNLIFLGTTVYLINAYTIFAASVLAANAVLRSLFGAAFPLFTRVMYENLGTRWASSILGFLALAMLPAPFIFYKCGARIRSRCAYASEAEKAMTTLRLKAQQEQTPIDQASVRIPTVTKQEEVYEDIQGSHELVKISTTIKRSISNASDPQQLLRTTSKAESMVGVAVYEASPYDIDRINTNDSVAGVNLRRISTNKS